MDAHNAHIKCKVVFEKYLDTTSPENLDPALICRDDQCELGKLLHGPAYKQFHMHGAFYTLRAIHAQLHFVAGNVVQKIKENDRAAAVALFDTGYADVSRKVMQSLTELYKQVDKKRQSADKVGAG